MQCCNSMVYINSNSRCYFLAFEIHKDDKGLLYESGIYHYYYIDFKNNPFAIEYDPLDMLKEG